MMMIINLPFFCSFT